MYIYTEGEGVWHLPRHCPLPVERRVGYGGGNGLFGMVVQNK